MAHGDILIFLTNITWVFTLFLFTYFFFVLFFLPTFYKKVRARTLIYSLYERLTFFAIRTYAFGSYLFFAEFKRSLITLFLNLLLTNSLSFVVSKAFNASFADSLRSILFSDVSLTDSDSSTSTKTIFSRLLVEFSQSSIIFNKYLGR